MWWKYVEIREMMDVTLGELIEALPAEISKIGAPGFNDFISVQLLEGFLFQNGMPCREFGILGTILSHATHR